VPVAAEHFHGDGAGSEVAVVRTDGVLVRDTAPSSTQPAGELALSRASRVADSLAGERSRAPSLPGVWSAAFRLVRSHGSTLPLLRRAFSVRQDERIVERTLLNASLAEPEDVTSVVEVR